MNHALQGCDCLPLSRFLLETCEEDKWLEKETKTAYKHRGLKPITPQRVNGGINWNHGEDPRVSPTRELGMEPNVTNFLRGRTVHSHFTAHTPFPKTSVLLG